MNKPLFALVSLIAASTTFAADYTWTDGESYTLDAEDTLTIDCSAGAKDFTSGSISGAGTVTVTGSNHFNLKYALATVKPFENFTGKIVIEDGAYIYCNNARNNDYLEISPFGGATIEFRGETAPATIRGFKQANGVVFSNDIIVPSGKTGIIDDREAFSGGGCNLKLSGAISGDGELTVWSQYRWVHLTGDNSGFSGTFYLKNEYDDQYSDFTFDSASSGSKDAIWDINTSRPIYLNQATSSTLELGSFNAYVSDNKSTTTGYGISLGHSSTTVRIGNKANSSITLPFINKAFTLNKVGTGTTLALGSAVTFVSGTTLDIDEGTLELDGCDISGVATDFASGTTLKVTANGGTAAIGVALANVDLTDGNLTFAGDSNWETGTETNLFTLSGTGFDASKIKVSGLGGKAGVAITLDGSAVKATITIPSLYWKGTADADWTDANAWQSEDGSVSYTFSAGDRVVLSAGQTIKISSDVAPGSVTVSGAASLTGNGTITVDEFAGAGSLTVASGSVRLDGTLSVPLAIASGATAALGSQTLTNVGKTNVPNITGAGTLLVSNANIVVTHQEQYNLFTGFDGDVKFAPGGYMEYLPTTADGTTQESNKKPLCQGKMIFAGGVLRGFSGTNARNNITFANDIEVVANTTSYITNNAARSSTYCNLSFSGKFTGSGVLWVNHGWNSGRSCDFTGDLSDFEGAIHFIGGGFGKIKSANSSSEDMAWSIYQQDHLNIEAGNNSRLKLGALNNTRDGDRFNAYNSGMTYEIGGRNEDCEVKGNFYGNAITLVKTGAAKFTLGSSVTMVSGSTVIVSNGTFEINCSTALAAPVTIVPGAALGGTGKCSTVTFEDGAKVDFGTLPENPTKGATVDGVTVSSFTWTQKPTVVQPTGLKGKWVLKSRSNGDGTITLYAEYMKPGLVIIVH